MLAFIFVKTQVPETKGRSLEEIEENLQQDDGASQGEPTAAGAGHTPDRTLTPQRSSTRVHVGDGYRG